MRTPTKTLISDLKSLAKDIRLQDDVANVIIVEAAARLDEMYYTIEELKRQLDGRDY